MPQAEAGSTPIAHRTVDFASITTFGTLTGDYSRIHFDKRAGEEAGYGGPIAHGLLTACWSIGALTLHAPHLLRIGDPEAIQTGFSLRLANIVRAEDQFSLRVGTESQVRGDATRTAFEALNQDSQVTAKGSIEVSSILPRMDTARSAHAATEPREPWALKPWVLPSSPSVYYAEDLVEKGPRGRCAAHTIAESEITAFARHSGELNPHYLDESFARSSRYGARLVPPMFSFCLAFSDFLRDLLTAPMPAEGFAGHIGDAWQLFEPIHAGDTLRTHHQPIGFTPSKSSPGRAIVRFGIQVVNQFDRVVQEGETVMLIPTQRSGSK